MTDIGSIHSNKRTLTAVRQTQNIDEQHTPFSVGQPTHGQFVKFISNGDIKDYQVACLEGVMQHRDNSNPNTTEMATMQLVHHWIRNGKTFLVGLVHDKNRRMIRFCERNLGCSVMGTHVDSDGVTWHTLRCEVFEKIALDYKQRPNPNEHWSVFDLAQQWLTEKDRFRHSRVRMSRSESDPKPSLPLS